MYIQVGDMIEVVVTESVSALFVMSCTEPSLKGCRHDNTGAGCLEHALITGYGGVGYTEG